MALSAAVNVVEKTDHLMNYPLAAAAQLFKGALVKVNAAGFLAEAVAEVGAIFAGVMDKTVDNTAGSAGDLKGNVRARGRFLFTGLSGFTQADVKSLVYASADDTFSVTQGANELLIGRITEFVSASSVWIELITNPDQ